MRGAIIIRKSGLLWGFFYLTGWDWSRENTLRSRPHHMPTKTNHSWFPSFDEAVEWLSMGCNYLLFKLTFVLVCLAVVITLVSRYDALSMKNRSNTSSLDLFNLINHGGPVVFWWYTDLVAIHIHYSYASGARSVRLVHIQKTHWLQESVIISFWSRAFGFD